MVNEVDYDGGWLQFKGLHVGGEGFIIVKFSRMSGVRFSRYSKRHTQVYRPRTAF